METNKKHIVYLGCSNFPYGYAETQKILLISKSLVLTDNTVTVLSTKGVYSRNEHPNLGKSIDYDGIQVEYLTGPYRKDRFLKRNFLKLVGRYKEISWLRKKSKTGELNFAILSTHNTLEIIYYNVLGRLFNFKTILNYVEYHSDLKKNWYEPGLWLNDKMYDSFAPRHSDFVFPISDYLINHLQRVAPGKKYLKIPGLTDFDRYTDIITVNDAPYFLFCGAAGYREIIYFVIDSFSLLQENATSLYLVINGSSEDLEEIKDYILKSGKASKIKLLSKLSEKELFGYYKHALALLIPLRPILKDIARFPHKTGEYLASGNPVVSTNYGEIKKYFKDNESMLLAESYEITLFAEKMNFVITNREKAKEIGLKGKEIASELFDYKNRAPVINQFLEQNIDS